MKITFTSEPAKCGHALDSCVMLSKSYISEERLIEVVKAANLDKEMFLVVRNNEGRYTAVFMFNHRADAIPALHIIQCGFAVVGA
jgi:hypothetical protein